MLWSKGHWLWLYEQQKQTVFFLGGGIVITHLKTCVGTLSLVRVCNMGCLADEPAQHSEGFVEQLTGALVFFFFVQRFLLYYWWEHQFCHGMFVLQWKPFCFNIFRTLCSGTVCKTCWIVSTIIGCNILFCIVFKLWGSRHASQLSSIFCWLWI